MVNISSSNELRNVHLSYINIYMYIYTYIHSSKHAETKKE
jgi:hypothetical protein